ncbi:MAG: hypothetical protein KGI41_00685 [Patescibacteria group bacterium]|nr:hypothetical protein [Patescibacteria group bacterium]MDE1965745.1 hypothetical protein [Patescibacteria group bacterium]
MQKTLIALASLCALAAGPAFAFAAETGPDMALSATGTASVGVGAAVSDDASGILVTHESAKAMLSADGGISASGTPAASASHTGTSSPQGAASPVDGLRAHADAMAAGDAQVSSVKLSPAQVSLAYDEPAELFGFIGMRLPVQVSVSAAGVTTMTYPWYRFLFSTDSVGLSVRTQAAVASVLPAHVSASGGFTLSEQARILDALHGALENPVSTGGA